MFGAGACVGAVASAVAIFLPCRLFHPFSYIRFRLHPAFSLSGLLLLPNRLHISETIFPVSPHQHCLRHIHYQHSPSLLARTLSPAEASSPDTQVAFSTQVDSIANMYYLDMSYPVEERQRALEKRQAAEEAQAKATAMQAQAEAQAHAHAQAQAHAHAQAQVQAQARSQAESQPQVNHRPGAPSHKSNPGFQIPYNALQSKMQKTTPPSLLQPTANRPSIPQSRSSSFLSGMYRPMGLTLSGSASGPHSAFSSPYTSPLPSPGLNGPSKKPWFPFGPDDSTNRK